MLPRNRFNPANTNTFWPRLCSLMASGKHTVLLAEDDPNVSAMICMLLEAHNFHVRIADSGLQALRMAQDLMPDIVVLDINLPEMSGLEICRVLKANPQTCTIPVVFCSGEGDLASEALALGGAAFLEKPDGILKLTACLSEILNGERTNRRHNFMGNS